ICFVNDLTGWAGTGVQFSGEIYKTTNGGANWISIYNYDCQMTTRFYNTNIGYTNSYYGQFRKSTDGGLSWTQIPLPSTGYGYQYMQLLDTNIIYMCSFDGYFAKSTNGASSWLVYPTGNTMPLFSLSFVNSQTGYCVGGNSSGVPYIVKTTNAGVNWSVQQGVPPYELYGVYFINANTGWAVGDSGRIIKTTNGGGVVGVEHYANEIPEKFNLYQNFPNPFNPSTTIRFDIAEPGFVNLYVYDILGREVEVLVNKFLQPGRYEAAFDASLLSSGIYFNKLKSGDYTNIKKLVLIK
ncbi:MAG TPA: T9SS type A sorting domain-containing protein, partial [Ignavibacteria bacterium]